jgi:hypothetical protein
MGLHCPNCSTVVLINGGSHARLDMAYCAIGPPPREPLTGSRWSTLALLNNHTVTVLLRPTKWIVSTRWAVEFRRSSHPWATDSSMSIGGNDC